MRALATTVVRWTMLGLLGLGVLILAFAIVGGGIAALIGGPASDDVDRPAREGGIQCYSVADGTDQVCLDEFGNSVD